MGGVALELAFSRVSSPDEPALAVAAMLQAMRHRGRDGARLVVIEPAAAAHGGIALGHAATWLTDEEVGTAQPHHARGLWVVLDGRVDDRAALALDLSLREVTTDAALAAAALDRFGRRALERMRGEFTLVAHDARSGQTLAAPDRLGAAPLYYRWADGGRGSTTPLGRRPSPITSLRVASEKQALFADGPPPSVSFPQLALATTEEYVEREATLYQEIFAIPPGHVLVVEGGAAHVEAYWELDPTRRLAIQDPRDASAWLRSELNDAIRDRLRARGGRIASTVSGGLDSSTIAALATRIARARGTAPPLLVTVRYPDPVTDETALSTDLASHLGLPLHVHDPPRGPGSFPVPTSLESLYDPYTTLLERMCATARDHGCCSISLGFGGDETQRNTGYEVDESLQRGEFVGAVRWAGPMSERWAVRRLLTTTLRRLAGRPRPVQPFDVPAVLTPEARAAIEAERAERGARLERAGVGGAKRVLHGSFVEGDAAPAGMVHGAHAAARLGVGFLQPFLDVRVVELMLALPLSVRPDPFSRKPLLRRISEDVAPASISTRTDRACFAVFYKQVLAENRSAYGALVGGGRLAQLGVLEPGAGLQCLNAGASDASEVQMAMNVVAFEGWLAALDERRTTRRPEPTSGLPEPDPPVNASARTRIVW